MGTNTIHQIGNKSERSMKALESQKPRRDNASKGDETAKKVRSLLFIMSMLLAVEAVYRTIQKRLMPMNIIVVKQKKGAVVRKLRRFLRQCDMYINVNNRKINPRPCICINPITVTKKAVLAALRPLGYSSRFMNDVSAKGAIA